MTCRICEKSLNGLGRFSVILPSGQERGPFCSFCIRTAEMQVKQLEGNWDRSKDGPTLSDIL